MTVLFVSAWILGTLIVGCENTTVSAPGSSSSGSSSGSSSSSGSTSSTVVVISPSSLPLNSISQSSTIFTASGGSGTYTSWLLSNINLGTINPNNATATYHSNAIVGTNTLTVTDSNGHSAIATITQTLGG